MNELEKRANKHKKKQDGLSPFCSLGERLDRKSIDKNRIDIARLLGIPSGGIIVSENGRVEIHNIPEDDARRYSNILRNKVKDIRLIPGKYDFKKIPMPGQMPNRLVTISGMLKDNLTEEVLKENMNESMSDINWTDSSVKTIRNELSALPEGAKLIIKVSNAHIYDKDAWKTIPITYIMTKKDDSKLTSSVWSYVKKEVSYKGSNNISMGELSEIISSGGNKNFGDIDSVEVVDTLIEKKKKKKPYDSMNPNAGNVEHNINMFNHMNSPTDGPSNNPVSGPFGGDVSTPSSDGCCESLKKKFVEGMRLTNGMREDEHYYFDDGNYSYHFFSKADRYGIINQFAVLVVDYGFEFHYDKMYKDEKTGVDTIPVTMRHEPPKKICYFEFDEDTRPDIVDAFLDDDMNAFRNAVKAAAEKEIEKNPLNETKLKEAATKTVYRAEYYEPKLGKWISYYENSDVEKVKSNKDAPIIGNPKIRVAEYTVSGVRKPSYKFVKLVESVEYKEQYYMAKYRGVNTDRLHKVYFSCDGDFEDAENLLDELIAEPYTSARVLGTVSKAAAERDGFTKIGGTSGQELDDDFNMSTRTLW